MFLCRKVILAGLLCVCITSVTYSQIGPPPCVKKCKNLATTDAWTAAPDGCLAYSDIFGAVMYTQTGSGGKAVQQFQNIGGKAVPRKVDRYTVSGCTEICTGVTSARQMKQGTKGNGQQVDLYLCMPSP